MKILKRISTLCVATALVASSLAFPASAAGYSHTEFKYGKSYFKNEWERTRVFSTGGRVIAYMTWGFDTDWIDEDYCWTKAKLSGCKSTSKVFRDGWDDDFEADDPNVLAGSYSKTELRHRVYNVQYRMELSKSYSGVTSTWDETTIH